MGEQIRLDVLLTKRGHFSSRTKAQAAIAAGLVIVNGKIIEKSGQIVPDCAILKVTQSDNSLVGRGGEKLRYALQNFNIDVNAKICLDVGASTGGFTQVLLENGASLVFAIDVGHSQLAEVLRDDSRVVNIEHCNFRYFYSTQLSPIPNFACVDVSFISLKLILPKLAECLQNGAEAVCLIKPQFEAGREALNKHGVVKNDKIHAHVLEEIKQAATDYGFTVNGVCESPILGGSGNKEFLMSIIR